MLNIIKFKTMNIEKKIEDYLHFYLGCDCKIKMQNGRLSGTMQLTYDLIYACFDGKKEERVSVKLLLRPLSDMTEKEAKAWLETYHNAAIVYICEKSNTGIWYGFNYNKINECFRNYEDFKKGWPEGFKYLLSKSFDLFGLIDAGLAIDKTKIKYL